MIKTFSILAFAVLLSGAALAATSPLTGFSRDTNDDLFGYYMAPDPPHAIKVGHYQLQAFAIGIQDDLRKWESGQDRSPDYAPVMFQFTDLSSKMVKNEDTGEMEHQGTARVLPTAYRIKGNTISFVGSSREIGAVSFAGTLDIKAIKSLNAKNGTENAQAQSSGLVLKGDLTIAGKVYKNVGFTWFAGSD